MMFRLTPKFGLHRVLRTDQRRKSRTACIWISVFCDQNRCYVSKFFFISFFVRIARDAFFFKKFDLEKTYFREYHVEGCSFDCDSLSDQSKNKEIEWFTTAHD